jgi:serine/threonine-protein kinase
LKPANVMVGKYGEVQVVDWGFAKILAQGGIADERESKRGSDPDEIHGARSGTPGSDSVAGSVFGTLAYMPPEQARGEVRALAQRSDVFALGAILCEILSGLPPYCKRDGNVREQAEGARLDPAFARLDGSDADPELIALCKRCLSPEREARPSDAGALAEEMAAYLSAAEQRGRLSEIDLARAKLRHKVTMGLSAAALVLVTAGVGSYAWWQGEAERQEREIRQEVAESIQESELSLARAEVLLDSDSSNTVGLTRLSDAIVAAERAKSIAGELEDIQLEIDGQLAVLHAKRDAAVESAERNEREETLRKNLFEARQWVRIAVLDGKEVGDAPYFERFDGAFADYGVDLERTTADEAAEELDGKFNSEIAGALVFWSIHRRSLEKTSSSDDGKGISWQKLVAIAQKLDEGSPWRQSLYSALQDPDHHRDQFLTLAKEIGHQDVTSIDYYMLGVELSLHVDRKTALEMLAEGQRRFPEDLKITWWLALEYFRQGNTEEAIRLLHAAQALSPENIQIPIQLGSYLEEHGEISAAEAVLRQAVIVYPESSRPHSSLAALLFRQGRADQAVEAVETALELNPKDGLALNVMGVIRRELHGDLEGAIEMYRKATEVWDDPVLLNNLVAVLSDQGKFEEANEFSRRAVIHERERAFTYVTWGQTLLKKRDIDGAGEKFHKAVDVGPDFAMAHAYLGNYLMVLGKRDESRTHLEKALELDANSAEANHFMGHFYWQDAGTEDLAIEAFLRTAELDPFDGILLTELADHLHNLDAMDEAVALLENSLDLPGTHHGLSLHYLAGIYAGHGDPDAALDYFEDSIRAGYDDAAHIADCSDLNNIRKHPRFAEIVALIKK